METLGDRIKKIRRHFDITQAEFATRIGAVQTSIARYESDDRIPSSTVREMICREFRVNRQWLESGEGEMFIAEDDELFTTLRTTYGLNDMDIAAIKSFLELPPEYRRGVLEWGKKFAERTADRLGVEFSARDEVRKPDSEKTREEVTAIIGAEWDDKKAAEKRGILTSSAFTGTSGTSKKIGNST